MTDRHGQPRSVPWSLGAQLATEQHDRAQVLRRGREPQLGDQLTAPGERLEAEKTAEGETDHDHADGEHDGECIERALVDAPERDVAREVGRGDPLQPGGRIVPDRPGDGSLPGDEHGTDAGGAPAGEPDGVGDDAGTDEQRADDRTVDRAARRPGGPRSGKLGGDELAHDRPDQAEAEHHRAEALPDRREEHELPRQRCQQHVTDVGDLHRDRAAVGTTAQTHGHGQHHGDAEDRRRLGEQHVDVDLVVDQPVDGVGHDHDEGQPGEREQVDAIRDVPPVGRAEPVLRPGPTKFAQRGTGIRHRQ